MRDHFRATLQHMPMFEQEVKHFEAHRHEWITRGETDRWVAIHGDHLVGFWDTLGDAVATVEDKFGDKPTFIRQVTVEDPAHVIHRA